MAVVRKLFEIRSRTMTTTTMMMIQKAIDLTRRANILNFPNIKWHGFCVEEHFPGAKEMNRNGYTHLNYGVSHKSFHTEIIFTS